MGALMKAGQRRRLWIWLGLIYCGCVAIRYFLATLTTAYPTVGIDEFLYYSMGKSIATEGTLLYRGQPALYNFIIYPLCLSPIYLLLPFGTNFYRAIQLWNAILMNLAVFPIYRLCELMFKERKKALWVSAVVMLLPDFSLNGFIFSEAVIYPLFFCLALQIYQTIRQKSVGKYILIGILGTLLYYTKPGSVVPALVFLIVSMLIGAVRKNQKAILYSIYGLIAFALSFLAVWLVVRFCFGYEGSFFSVYHNQVSVDKGLGLDVFFRTVARFPYYFILACGILPTVFFVARIRKMEEKERAFYGYFLLSLALVLIGTAWFINRVEQMTCLPIRYSAMYIPLIIIGSLSSSERREEERNQSISISAVLICAYVVLCTAIWGSTTGIANYLENHFVVSLAILFQPNAKGIGDILIYGMTLVSLFLIARKPKKGSYQLAIVSVFIVAAVTNNVGGYIATGSNAYQFLQDEAIDVQMNLIKGDEYLYVFSNEMTSDHGLNVYSKHNNQHLEWYDFFNNIHEHGGAYAPYVPVSERGMTSEAGTTPDVNVLVAEQTTYPLIKFSENIQGTITEYESFYVGRFESGARIVDAMLGNIERFKLLRTDYGVLTLYRDDWVEHPVKVTLKIESPVDQHMRFFANNDESITIDLEAGAHAYEFLIPKAAKGYNFIVDQADILVRGFDVDSWEQ